MRPALLPVGLLALLAITGCDSPSYQIVGAPFCVNERSAGVEFEKDLVFVTKGAREHSIQSLSGGIGGPFPLGGARDPNLIAAVVECEEYPKQFPQGWENQITDDKVPELCPDQRVVFHGKLKLEENERAKALGLGGFLRIPALDTKCKSGELIQEDARTVSQILAEFNESVQRYHNKHEKMPANLDELSKATLQPELPTDPWGTPVRFTNKDGRVYLHSAGPDEKPDTDDDVEMISMGPGDMTSITSFDAVGFNPGTDWLAYVQAYVKVK